MTIRVLHRGHSRVELMMSSEHALHIAICLCGEINTGRTMRNREHPPAIDNRDVCLFILADNTETISFKTYSHGRSTSKSKGWMRGWASRDGLLLRRG